MGEDDRVKWTRAVHYVRELAEKCAELDGLSSSIYQLRVRQMWAVGDILGTVRDIDRVTVALVVDLPVEDMPWLGEPLGAEHWANATRVSRNPIRPLWRSLRAPIWNHVIDRPALVWDAANGVAEETLAALRDGQGHRVRQPEQDGLAARMEAELGVSLRALRRHTELYGDKRWGAGKLTPVSDALWRISSGYLDLLDATKVQTPGSAVEETTGGR